MTLTPQDESRLSPLAQRFREAFQAALPQVTAQEAVDEGYRIQIPAKDEHTGGMEVLVEPQEITVSVGCHYHGHFPPTGDADTDERVAREACTDAIRFIENILNDRTLIRVYLSGQQVNGAMAHERDEFNLDQETGEFRDYVWSGPVRRVGEVE